MAYRVFPINSDESASVAPGLNDFDLLRVPTWLLTEGVLQSYTGQAVVSQNGTPNMSVNVAAGLVLVEITNTNVAHGRTYKTWFESTSQVNLAIAAADATHPRIDRIIARIDVGDGTEGSANPNANASDIGAYEVVQGTPAASPSAPAEPANSHTLALVTVGAGVTSIVTANIANAVEYVELRTDALQDVARVADLISTANGKGARTIGVEDAAGNFASTNVEDALAELLGMIGEVSDEAYDETTWNGVTTVAPSKNAVRDLIESLAEPNVEQLLLATGDSGTGSNHTSEIDLSPNYTIPANDLIAGVGYEFEMGGQINWSTGTVRIRVKLGSTTILDSGALTPSSGGSWYIKGHIAGTAAAGASVAVRGIEHLVLIATNNLVKSSVNVATNAAQIFQVSIQFGSAALSNSATLGYMNLKRITTL